MKPELLETLWGRLAGMAAEAFRMTDGETDRFRGNRIARLIGLLPYLAGCEDAERTSLAHLGTFILANRGAARRAFDHKPSDDSEVLGRLRTISDFKGGDSAILDRGMALLGLCMLSGYRRDADKDRLTEEYNPIVSGAWEPEETDRALRKMPGAKSADALDAILTPGEASVLYWQP